MATIRPVRADTLPDSSAKTDFYALIDNSKLTDGVQGDILYFNGTDWVNLAAGTSGKYLKTQGAGANPLWDTVSTSALNQGTFTATAVVVTHNKGLTAPYALPIFFSNNDGYEILPDNIVFGANALTATLSSYTIVSGTASAYGYTYVG